MLLCFFSAASLFTLIKVQLVTLEKQSDTRLDVHVKCLLLLSNVTQDSAGSTRYSHIPHYQISLNHFLDSAVGPCSYTDG
jgi:hypothetical protein